MTAPLILGTNSIKDVGYDVDNSLRFDAGSSDYLNRTNGTPTNNDICTFSFWIKLCRSSTSDAIFSAHTDGSNRHQLFHLSNGKMQFFHQVSGTANINLTTNRLFRDVSAWYHFVYEVDTSQSTASDRVKMYVNGVQETSFATETYPSQNDNIRFNTNSLVQEIGRANASDHGNYYLAEFVFIDGQALDPTSFGQFDEDSGIWKPKNVSGLTFGNNGFYLPFENSGALGQDDSGNGNNFTVNNLTSIDQSTDTCTNNFATLNPLWRSLYNPVFSNGNLKIETPAVAQFHNAVSSLGVSSGKWYLEMKCNGSPNSANYFGIGNEDEIDNFSQSSTVIGNTTQGFSFFLITGDKRTNGSNSSYGSALADGDIMMYAIDLDNGKVWFGKNGTFFASGDPASGTNEAFSGLSGTFFIGGSLYNGGVSSVEFNFGNPPYTISSGNSDGNGYGNFEYSVPSGYYALNTKNLAEYG